MFLRDTNLVVGLEELGLRRFSIQNLKDYFFIAILQTLVVLELFTIVADVYILQLSNF